MQVDPLTKKLSVQGKEIGIVYYRTGYVAEQYNGERDWKIREALELSMAIKCPTIDLHLLTLKKFQEAFSCDEFLYSVLTDRHQEIADSL